MSKWQLILFICLLYAWLYQVSLSNSEVVKLSNSIDSRSLYRWSPGVSLGHIRELTFTDGVTRSMETVSLDPLVFEISGLLSIEECEDLIAEAQGKLTQSKIKDDAHMANLGYQSGGYRSSRTAWIPSDARIFTELVNRTAELTQMPRQMVEQSGPLQVVFYEKGGHYAPHHDSLKFGKGSHVRRYLTLLYVLEEPDDGGGTAFPLAGTRDLAWVDYFTQHAVGFNGRPCSGLVLRPPRGSALLWYNHFTDFSVDAAGLGAADVKSLHSGCEVTLGRRVVANFWFRVPESLVMNDNIDGRESTDALSPKLVGTPRQLFEILSPLIGTNSSGFTVSFGDDAMKSDEHFRIEHLQEIFGRSQDAGLIVERDATLAKLQTHLDLTDVMKIGANVSIYNIAPLLSNAKVPQFLDYLDIDLSSAGCAIMMEIFARGYRPRSFAVRANPEIPSPVCFGVHGTQALVSIQGSLGFYGCSPRLLIDLANIFDYTLIWVQRPCSLAFIQTDLLQNSSFQHAEEREVIQALVLSCPSKHFGVLGSYEEWNRVAHDEARVLASVRKAVQIACNISQDPFQTMRVETLSLAECFVPYTITLSAGDFIRNHQQLSGPQEKHDAHPRVEL